MEKEKRKKNKRLMVRLHLVDYICVYLRTLERFRLFVLMRSSNLPGVPVTISTCTCIHVNSMYIFTVYWTLTNKKHYNNQTTNNNEMRQYVSLLRR